MKPMPFKKAKNLVARQYMDMLPDGDSFSEETAEEIKQALDWSEVMETLDSLGFGNDQAMEFVLDAIAPDSGDE